MKAFLLVLFLLINCSAVFSQNDDSTTQWEMKQYYMVFLTKGPNRNQDSTTAAAIQKDHLDNINRLYEAKKINVAGPFLDDGNLRGIFIFNVETEKEVIELLQTDPAITSGRLSYEIHPWMTAKGVCFE